MSPEERQKLCAALRAWQSGYKVSDDFGRAADEIERLAADVEHWKMIANRAYIDPKPFTRSNAEPVALRTQFEEWSFARGHRNFTKLEGGYLLPEIQKDWLAFKGLAGF